MSGDIIFSCYIWIRFNPLINYGLHIEHVHILPEDLIVYIFYISLFNVLDLVLCESIGLAEFLEILFITLPCISQSLSKPPKRHYCWHIDEIFYIIPCFIIYCTQDQLCEFIDCPFLLSFLHLNPAALRMLQMLFVLAVDYFAFFFCCIYYQRMTLIPF